MAFIYLGGLWISLGVQIDNNVEKVIILGQSNSDEKL
jgi:hypothetical protein